LETLGLFGWRTSLSYQMDQLIVRFDFNDVAELAKEGTYTTICRLLSSWLRMNLRVRKVTGASRSAMLASMTDETRKTISLCQIAVRNR
jgi:hypothetical protein